MSTVNSSTLLKIEIALNKYMMQKFCLRISSFPLPCECDGVPSIVLQTRAVCITDKVLTNGMKICIERTMSPLISEKRTMSLSDISCQRMPELDGLAVHISSNMGRNCIPKNSIFFLMKLNLPHSRDQIAKTEFLSTPQKHKGP